MNSISYIHFIRLSMMGPGRGRPRIIENSMLDFRAPHPATQNHEPPTFSVILEQPGPPSPHSKTTKIIGFHTSSIIFEPPRAPPSSPKPFKSSEFPIKPWVWGCLNTPRLLHKNINILQISSNFCGSGAARVTFKRIIWFLRGAGGSRTNPSSDLGLLRCYSPMRQ